MFGADFERQAIILISEGHLYYLQLFIEWNVIDLK